MTVVKINAIEVPPGAGPELEKRFSNRAHAVDGQPGDAEVRLVQGGAPGPDPVFVAHPREGSRVRREAGYGEGACCDKRHPIR